MGWRLSASRWRARRRRRSCCGRRTIRWRGRRGCAGCWRRWSERSLSDGQESAELAAHPEGDVLLLDEPLEGGGAQAALVRGHGEGAAEGADGALKVGGRDAQRVRGELLVGAGELREDEDAIALVHEGAFLGDEVHAVDDGVDEQHVVEAHAGDRLGVVVLVEDVYGLPVAVAVLVVDGIDSLEHLVGVGLVDAELAAGGYQELQQGDPAPVLRVALQEELEGAEAADDIFAGLGAVDADDGLGTEAGADLLLLCLDLL